ncbi:flagellar export chaperone FliS [Campylobacter pinnipediorum]|uniref:Flagellar secretion chaperone FliS n=1 Tax=Campylobacter pinnipediorum subsp. caledonicus TaxID=1874362 RepID=A0A1S6U867_9BACT|nr:flagellar export chaperone FliS [Campylobacter pinnipediorum]AQW83086.1 flagellar protein FliS [Campylobacter pinnipediorum subsp. pinnipediorum]AQW84653.1 flagellar protein FliS [Campylobacter pinnipediorum subsp. pinnipediorum]AQW86255.1 flagellar protein FliS [Campylobacter pinnipediorum subsp. caledonicus]AQW87862.1 flagellar protein FliS [Campylobacter pinnipediorum subsp. caledonicus]OPA71978.1 flagellar export chaperone FliS [Campylobacter pinnipediorum subsp. caledonicus]
MATNSNLAYAAYAQSSVGGIESPTKLIQMLYDGILRFIFRTKKAIEAGDFEQKVYYINRTNAIFVELLNSLDYSQGDVAHYLSGLYTRQIQLLAMANIKNDVEILNEITNVVKQLNEAWREVTSDE